MTFCNMDLRRVFAGIAAFLCAANVATEVYAQAPPEPEVITFAATDGFPLKMSYYAAKEDKNPNGLMNAPVVIFLHGEKGTRLQWDRGSAPKGKEPVPNYLNQQGYAVLVLDFRKHGESIVEGQADEVIKPIDYLAMAAGDLAAVKNFLYEEHMKQKLNMSKLAVVATDVSVPVALAFAEADWRQVPFDDSPLASERTPRGQDVRALVMISPKLKAGSLNGAKSIQYLKAPQFGISMLFIAGEQDTAAMRDLKTLHNGAMASAKSEERIVMFTPPAKDAGIPLLVKAPTSISEIIKFLDERVAKVEIPWRDRRSRLNR